MTPPLTGLIVDLLGFLTGTVLYAMLVVMVWRDRAASGPASSMRRGLLPLATGCCGLLWNVGALVSFVPRVANAGVPAPAVVAVAFGALGFLPAVVVHSLLEGRETAVRRHFIDTVVGLSDQMASAPERAPRTMGTLNALTKLGGAALFIAHVLPRKFEDQRVVKAVTEAVDILAAGGFKTETDRQARELMIAFIRDRLREMDKPSNGIMAKYAVEDLRKQLARLMASRPITIR